MPPVEVLEQFYPVLFEEFSLREGSGGAGEFRGGFGINYAIKLRRGEARVSMVMDHGRTGPQGVLGGGRTAAPTRVQVDQGGKTYRPPHLSKDQDIQIGVGDVVRVSTPGGGGFGDPAQARSRRDRPRCGARLLHAKPRRARSSASGWPRNEPSLLDAGASLRSGRRWSGRQRSSADDAPLARAVSL